LSFATIKPQAAANEAAMRPMSGRLPVERNSLAPVAIAISAVKTPSVVVFQLFIVLFLSLIVPPNGEQSHNANGEAKD